MRVHRPRRPELAAVVLGPAVDVVEGLGVVEGELVELGHGQVLEKAPRPRRVVRLVDAAVAAVEDVVGVALDEGHGVVVAVLVRLVDAAPGLAAVVRGPEARVHLVDAVEGVGVGEDLLVIVRARAAADVGVALLPALPAVGRPVEPFLLRAGFDRGVPSMRDTARPIFPTSAAGSPTVSLRQVLPASSLLWMPDSGPPPMNAATLRRL